MNELEQLQYLSRTLSVISDEWRYRILLIIMAKKTIHQKDLLALYNSQPGVHPVNQSSIAHHIAILKNTGILIRERRGKKVFYSVNASLLSDIQKFAKKYWDKSK